MQYFKSLNTLRAVAVMLVLFQHWVPLANRLQRLQTGPLGVDIFFTLSGFLITGIILKDIVSYRQMNRPTSTLVGHFFARRVLRILPAYALALLLTFLLKSYLFPFDPASWPYLLTFTFNLYVFRQLYWPGTIAHFWSLSVEEQYYLFWPFLMVIFAGRMKLLVMGGMILLAILVRYYLRYNTMADITTLSCLDAFGLGSMLAWLYQNRPEALDKIVRWLLWPMVILLLALPLMNYFGWLGFLFLKRFAQALVTVVVIAYLVRNESNPAMRFRWFWDNPVLVFIGKISYGIYLYHLLIPDFLPFHWALNYLIKLPALIAFSWVSFTCLEMPVLSLKKYFR